MRILMVNLWKMINSAGGAEKVFCEMANMLSERGHSVTALVFDNDKGNPFYHVNENVEFINSGQGCKLGKNLWQKIRASFYSKNEKELYSEKIYDDIKSKRLAPFVNGKNFDVIISYNPSATRILIHTLKVKTPIITMLHSSTDVIFKNASTDTLNALAKSRVIQVLMPGFCKEVLKYVKNANIIYIPNIVPQYKFFELPDAKENVIINVARFDKVYKRQYLLIEAFSLIATKYPNWKLEFYGDTDCDANYFKDIKRMVSERKLENRVLFKGTTINISQELFRAKIFAFPSSFEGFPLALTEAMSAGLPTIGYKNCPAVNELIKDGETGFLCDDGVEPLAQALDKLMGDRELRVQMGKAAKADMAQFAPEKIWNQWDDLIKKVVAK